MNLRVAMSSEVKSDDTPSRSESEREERDMSWMGQTRNRVIYTCPG